VSVSTTSHVQASTATTSSHLEAAHPFYRLLIANRDDHAVTGIDPPPSFFIVGAPRCGTTALSRALKDHPQISFSKPKETHFFLLAPEMPVDELRSTYLGVHHGGLTAEHKALGDGSVSYLYTPESIERALRFDPRAKFIAAVRNPLDLVPSYHARMVYDLEEDVADFSAAWDLQASRAAGQNIPKRCHDARLLLYGECGKLGQHVERLFEVAGRERCLIVVYDDFAKDQRAVYQRVLEFVGVEDDGRTKFSRKAENRGFKSSFLQQFVMNPPPWTLRLIEYSNKTMVRRLKRIRRTIEDFNTFPRTRPPLAPEMRAMLRAYYADDVAKLSGLLGRDLSHWLAEPEATAQP
jgi:hypothetical protein